YERAEIKDVLSYLKVVANPLDQEALLRIINVPRRGISDKTLDLLTQYNRKQGESLYEVLQKSAKKELQLEEELSDRAINGISSFLKIIETAREKFASTPLHEAFEWLIDAVHY